MDTPPFDLKTPGSIVYSGRMAAQGMRINRIGTQMKVKANREAFRDEPDAYLAAADLTPEEVKAIRSEDWKWLFAHGGNLQAMARIAAIQGQYLFHIAAQMCDEDVETIIASCPRRTHGLGGLEKWLE